MIALYPIHVITRCIMKRLHCTMYVVYIPKSGTETIWPDCADAQADFCLCNLHTTKMRILKLWLKHDPFWAQPVQKID